MTDKIRIPLNTLLENNNAEVIGFELDDNSKMTKVWIGQKRKPEEKGNANGKS